MVECYAFHMQVFQKKSKLLCYNFLCYEVEKDDFVLLASSHFSSVSSDINVVVRVNLRF